MHTDSTHGSRRTPFSILVYTGSDTDNAIGEDIIKLVFAQALREAFPDTHISWVPGYGRNGYFDNLLRPLSSLYVDEVITDLYIDGGLRGLLAPGHPILNRFFDLILDTQTTLSRTLFLRRVRHRTFISRNLGYLLSDRKPPPGLSAGTPQLVEKLLHLLAAATGEIVQARHTLRIEEHWHVQAEELLPEGPAYIGFAPGAGDQGKHKCWPLENYIATARRQGEYGRVPVFLLGPQERNWWPMIKERVGDALFPEGSELLKGKNIHGPSLLMALAGRLQVAVANCSGAGHMLAAGGAAMVSLFGPTQPDKFAPYARRLKTLRAQDFGSNEISSIPVDAVCQAIEALLE
ncbi:MAG: hypothetical protein A2W28_08410 [Gammaproteobacteria bacterium RBG_16_51_14]|nr:MAG: hypothetical protein A2W28_08410 [Gammaproteobacteria bacterium RBG_16_51_14]